jgi:hypothetical protein
LILDLSENPKAEDLLVQVQRPAIGWIDFEHSRGDSASCHGLQHLGHKVPTQALTAPSGPNAHAEERSFLGVIPGTHALAGTDDKLIGLEQKGASVPEHQVGGVAAEGGLGKRQQVNFDELANQLWVRRCDLCAPNVVETTAVVCQGDLQGCHLERVRHPGLREFVAWNCFQRI